MRRYLANATTQAELEELERIARLIEEKQGQLVDLMTANKLTMILPPPGGWPWAPEQAPAREPLERIEDLKRATPEEMLAAGQHLKERDSIMDSWERLERKGFVLARLPK